MSDFTPTTPLALQIRKTIFEKYNDVDTNFTNDDIFEIIKANGDVDPSWIIDLKLFDPLEKLHCDKCDNDIYLGSSEERKCPNPSCKSSI